MSKRETKRRKLCSLVFKEAWRFIRKNDNFILSLSSALKLSWKAVRGFIRLTYSKVRGTSYGNRQKVLRRLLKYDSRLIILSFKRESNNTVDSNAVKIIAHVFNKGSAAIGYLDKKQAADVSKLLDNGSVAFVVFEGITGIGKKYLGCNFSYAII